MPDTTFSEVKSIGPPTTRRTAVALDGTTVPVVAFDASAGGLQPRIKLPDALPAPSSLTFILVQHRAPEHTVHHDCTAGRHFDRLWR